MAHLELPLKYSESYLRNGHIRPINRIETVDTKHSLLSSQDVPGAEVLDKLSKLADGIRKLSNQNFESLEFITFAKTVEVEMKEPNMA